jgi:hypothetical protein
MPYHMACCTVYLTGISIFNTTNQSLLALHFCMLSYFTSCHWNKVCLTFYNNIGGILKPRIIWVTLEKFLFECLGELSRSLYDSKTSARERTQQWGPHGFCSLTAYKLADNPLVHRFRTSVQDPDPGGSVPGWGGHPSRVLENKQREGCLRESTAVRHRLEELDFLLRMNMSLRTSEVWKKAERAGPATQDLPEPN